MDIIVTDTSESGPAPVASGAAGCSGLSRALARVGITAGAVFIFAVIFFSGFLVSWTAGGHWSGQHMNSASMAACCHSGMGHHMMPDDHM